MVVVSGAAEDVVVETGVVVVGTYDVVVEMEVVPVVEAVVETGVVVVGTYEVEVVVTGAADVVVVTAGPDPPR